MAVRTCKVSCRDPQGVEHTLEVSAQSLYEAVAQALRVFREYEWYDLALAASVVAPHREREGSLPFEPLNPNAETVAAIKAAQQGELSRRASLTNC
jgi:hypothetical protein